MPRFDYIKYDELATGRAMNLKPIVEELETSIDALPNSREKALAITKLEECWMWVGKAIKVAQEKGE